MRISLSLACTRYDRTEAILDGIIKPDGIDFIPTSGSRPGETFWRMLNYEEFDCSEMGIRLSTEAIIQEGKEWEALPVFTSRHFFHTDVLVNRSAGIREPRDLEGKKVGLPEYRQSAAVWSRGVLKDEYEVKAEKIHWYVGRTSEKSTGIAPPSIQIDPVENTTLGEALSKGHLDALLVYSPTSSLVDVADSSLMGRTSVTTMFEDPKAEAIRYYNKTKIFPINHMIVIRKSVLSSYPWAAINIFKAFELSKRAAYQKWKDLESWEKFPCDIFLREGLKSQREVFGDDPFSYGLNENNQKILQKFVGYVHDQGLSAEVPDVLSIFAKTTLKL